MFVERELAEVDRVLGDLSSPTSSEVYQALRPYSSAATIAGLTAIVSPGPAGPAFPGAISFSHTGDATTGPGSFRFPMPTSATISGVAATADTAPTGAALIFDVNKNGTTIFTTQANRPTILAGANQSTEFAVPDVTSVATNDLITVDIDQIGSTEPGANVVVVIAFVD